MDVSVLICTHNSAQRLSQTFFHLSRQKVPETMRWEILVVDYASKDGTTELASQLWKNNGVPLRIFHESEAGKSPALDTGFKNAHGAVVCIVDDDNWVHEDYVRVAHETMEAHPDVGIVGAFGEAACEITPPFWFEEFKTSYAVGAQGRERGYAQQDRLWFWGAGSAVRRAAWLKLKEKGFKVLLNPSRSEGVFFYKGFTGGEDPELCYAIQLTGYKLWYEPDLIYRHFIPAKRLTLSFLKNACYGVSVSSPIIMLYHCEVVSDKFKKKLPKYIYGKWYSYMLTTCIQFCRGLLLSLFGKNGTRRIHCLMEFQLLKGKYNGMVKIGVRGFREIARSIKNLKIT